MTLSLLLRLFFFLFVIFVDGQCLVDQKKLLLELKSELVFQSSYSGYLMYWNVTGDCCKWEGVGCDDSGRVISLDLFASGISGGIGESSSLFRLTYLSKLILAFNDFNTSEIPNQFNRLPNLAYLDMSNSGFMGPFPSTLANLTRLVNLYSFNNSFTGPIPSFHNCKNLELIDLSHNNLMGSLSHLHFQGLTNLSYLDLSLNSLNGTIPRHLFGLPSIEYLALSNNKFSGQIKEFPIVNHSSLHHLDLSGNRIGGPIPNFFFQLRNVTQLMLSDNLFNGTFQLKKIRSLTRLSEFTLSNNNLSVDTTNESSSSLGYPILNTLHMSSCYLYDFPNLRNLSYLSDLDLSNNYIGGDIPSWIWEFPITRLDLSRNFLTDVQKPGNISASLQILDLHSNLLRCEFGLLPVQHDSHWGSYFFLADNSLTGVIPTFICKQYRLILLDLSFNNLSGSIPSCLLEESYSLQVLNLRGNNINGVIPDAKFQQCDLKTFDVSDNNLVGKIPKSLAYCEELVVMNVGNNNLEGSFPCMLPLSLRILLLRSNRFHGDLRCSKSWPNLQILDISSNNFSGTVSFLNLSSLRGMMLENSTHLRLNRSNSHFLGADSYYHNEVTLTVKGIEVKLVKIWPDFTCIDLSSNRFQGEIPDTIVNLSSLYLLNLSHNYLTNAIPRSLGALTELGSLDLSSNKLTGKIPQELAKLTFLSVLNVSYNHLTGMIPNGPQFQTFSEDSFVGNTGLCGFPLNRSCKSPHGPDPAPSEPKDEEIEWEYVFAALGYVVGFGSIAWILLCCRSLRERYFEKIEEVADKIFYERGRRRRHERRVRRREESRNGLRRRHQ